MAGTLKQVRFKLAWRNYRVGDVITPNGTLRDFLLGHGYVVVIDDNTQTDQTASPKINREIPASRIRKRA